MRLAGRGDDTLVFLPGFMIGAASYRELLGPVAAAGTTVVVPELYRRGLAALTGRTPVSVEAASAADLVRAEATRRGTGRVFLAGHSRGGQAAWLAAELLAGTGLPAGLVLVDPVDGEGRRPLTPVVTRKLATFTCPTVVVGAGLGGRCAPTSVNHRVFASATPHARHLVLDGLGHADMLQGRARTVGRWLCSGAADPDPGRAACSALIVAFVGRPASSLGQ
jgi:pimeloyl-ACP methyl ester carboxylesterase